MADELLDSIKSNAAAPAKVSGDAGSAEQHPLPDQIEAHRYAQAAEAVKKPLRGMRFSKLSPPGAA